MVPAPGEPCGARIPRATFGARLRHSGLFPEVLLMDPRFAGAASGIDMALFLVEQLFGPAVANDTVRYIEFRRATT